MHCTRVRLPNGLKAIVCSSGQLPLRHPCACGKAAPFQCDWKLGGRKTCDRYICARHAQEVGPDKHLCPEHQVAYRQWLAQRAPRG